jgi:hypothetical protein
MRTAQFRSHVDPSPRFARAPADVRRRRVVPPESIALRSCELFSLLDRVEAALAERPFTEHRSRSVKPSRYEQLKTALRGSLVVGGETATGAQKLQRSSAAGWQILIVPAGDVR